MNKQPPLKKKCKCDCHPMELYKTVDHCFFCSPAKKEECWACEDAPDGYKHHHCKDLNCPRNHHEPVGEEVKLPKCVFCKEEVNQMIQSWDYTFPAQIYHLGCVEPV